MLAHAADTAKPAAKAKPVSADKAKPAAAADKASPASDPKAAEKAMMDEMMKKAAPGPNHERLKKLEGTWNLTVRGYMDPSQPPSESKGTAVVTTIMDGRYSQEMVSGENMGMPFTGMGVTGYDNLAQKYVGSWVDNMGTGIMNSEGTYDASANVMNWTAHMIDAMTGKPTNYRMVTRFVDDNKHVFEMYAPGPDGKEMKMMEITYERKI